MSASKRLPKIVCLHGAGSSGAIFQVQARKIVQALKKQFQFIFLDAPFRAQPGPGMLPTYESAGPFHRWHCDMTASLHFDITREEIADERRTVHKQLLGILKACENNQEPPIVGIMAFSQGARVATGLLMHLLGEHKLNNLQFCILICPTWPPLPVYGAETATQTRLISDEHDAELVEAVSELRILKDDDDDDSDSATGDDNTSRRSSSSSSSTPSSASTAPSTPGPRDLIDIKSIHVQGLQDPWLSESKRLLSDHYDIKSAHVIEFEGGHCVPIIPQIANELAAVVQASYKPSSGMTNL